ncbi:MAG TPA: SAM-dependent methyltransferase [Candidatus Sulfotelmatobacter sp.]|nr:SAM-dependent methyltransferase [Candidatus Sulfotelmatobacter sp.]
MSALREKIEEEIRRDGPIRFSRYMEICLYDPELGYYSRHADQFGKAGDFYTSSDVHAVFGRLLARQFDEMWRALDRPPQLVIEELGPGRGLFAQDVLDWSEKKFPEFFHALRYVLVERSQALRQRIERTLEKYMQRGKAVLAPADKPRLKHLPGIIFANEFFDSLPVEIVGPQGSVRVDARSGRFVEELVPSSANELEFLDRFSILPETGERVEVPLLSQAHMSAAAEFDRGFMVIVDYGYTRDEQLAGRHRGTLKAIRQHSMSGSPYDAPGEQDITADVNFTALGAAAEQNGLRVEKLVTQSQFLMGIGEANQFADAFEDCRLPQERTKVALQLKHLVTPAGMGESFHVLVASKGVPADRVLSLAGLSFGRKD